MFFTFQFYFVVVKLRLTVYNKLYVSNIQSLCLLSNMLWHPDSIYWQPMPDNWRFTLPEPGTQFTWAIATSRGVTRSLIGRGGVYSYIGVLPDKFLLKSVVCKFVSKEISRAEHKYMNIHSPPPISYNYHDCWNHGSNFTCSSMGRPLD
jgi:hypothetical protein